MMSGISEIERAQKVYEELLIKNDQLKVFYQLLFSFSSKSGAFKTTDETLTKRFGRVYDMAQEIYPNYATEKMTEDELRRFNKRLKAENYSLHVCLDSLGKVVCEQKPVMSTQEPGAAYSSEIRGDSLPSNV